MSQRVTPSSSRSRLRPSRRALLTGLAAGAASLVAGHRGAVAADDGADTRPDGTIPIVVQARPITDFNPGMPGVRRFGSLEFRGGLVLTSPSPLFGGWSALIVEDDGRLLAISDKSQWLSGRLVMESDRPAGITQARIGLLRDEKGAPLRGKYEQDSESAALLEGNLTDGVLLVGFERDHRIARTPIRDGKPQAPTAFLPLPPDATRMSANEGFEAVAVLKGGPRKGAVVAFAERLIDDGHHSGWIWNAEMTEAKRFQLRDIDGYNITDAAGLPDGGLLVLERDFSILRGVRMRVRRMRADEIAPGARTDGEKLLEADMACEIDNMEGIAVHRNAKGELLVTVISDDNFRPSRQRTLLLQFALDAGT